MARQLCAAHAADAYVSAYRRHFDLVGPPPYHPASVDYFRAAPLNKAELLDRYTQHTAHCTSCLGALKNAERAKRVCKAVLLAAVAALPSLLALRPMRVRPLAAVAVAAALSAAILKVASDVAAKLTTGMGEYPPPRNRAAGAKGTARELRTVEQGRSS